MIVQILADLREQRIRQSLGQDVCPVVARLDIVQCYITLGPMITGRVVLHVDVLSLESGIRVSE